MVSVSLSVLLVVTLNLQLITAAGSKDFPEIQINDGKLRGIAMTSFKGNIFYAYRGIPYAEPPIGELRFKAPLRSKPWSDLRDATEEASVCAQVPLMGDTFIGSEDCLYLNVYTSKIESSENEELLPVIFWIHGGAFYAGDGGMEENGPEFLMDQPIVLVTINYRLGPFGFLSSGDQVIPGNFGLKDQVLALQWVRDNIEAFNGDSNRVTLYGYSAGAICVEAHLFSPLSKGLFHGVVYQSGAMNNECTLRSSPSAVLQVLTSVTNCDQYPSGPNYTKNQLKCLRGKSASELATATNKFPFWGIKIPQVYTPVHERQDNNDKWLEEPFLPEDPLEMLKEGRITSDVPAITGITQDEGITFTAIVRKTPHLFTKMDENFATITRLAMCLYRLQPEQFDSIKDFYFGNNSIDLTQVDNVTKFYSDAQFNWGQVRTAGYHAAVNTQPVFFYVFSFQGRISEIMALNFTKPLGVGHADDLAYVFQRRVPFPDGEPNDDELNIINRMVLMLANFAHTGNPTPSEDDPLLTEKWLPLPKDSKKRSKNFRYFNISSQPSMQQGRPFPERMKFWQQLRRNKKISTTAQRDEL